MVDVITMSWNILTITTLISVIVSQTMSDQSTADLILQSLGKIFFIKYIIDYLHITSEYENNKEWFHGFDILSRNLFLSKNTYKTYKNL